MKTSMHLKDYVELHPNNKMGWYLLGKEYEAQGLMGKANYCYNQAGEVYEAFESSKVPSEIWMSYEAKIREMAEQKERKYRLFRKIWLVLTLLVLIWLPSVEAPKYEAITGDTNDYDHITELQKVANRPQSDDPAEMFREIMPVFTAIDISNAVQRSSSLSSLLTSEQGSPLYTVVLGMKRSGNWLIWDENMPVAYTIERDSENGRAIVQSYDKKLCKCTPPDHSTLIKPAKMWRKQQEQLAVLSSAMTHFQSEKGRLPQSTQELIKPFPNNWIAGESKTMNASFEALRFRLASGKMVSPEQVDSVPSPLSMTVGNKPYFNKPLEIIVDKQSHRLALVSGNIILRNYPVGLGAERTPEGTFVITDKVMNPNGRSNGEFGSRGMQLSQTNYAIHGTDKPDSIGQDVSKGCVRMLKEDIEELFDLAPKGTKVTITSGVLPAQKVIPMNRYRTDHAEDQTNPGKVYHWLN